MIVCSGKSVFEGIAIGPIHVYKKEEQSVKRTKVTDLDAEVARYTAARETAIEQLQALHDKAVVEVGESGAEIFVALEEKNACCAVILNPFPFEKQEIRLVL